MPANFILITAQNPCPCGYLGDSLKECVCSAGSIYGYKRKISGPIIDRLDLNINVQRADFLRFKDSHSEPSAAVAKRVAAAREIQNQRLGGGRLNSRASSAEIKNLFEFSREAEVLLEQADVQYHFSARGYFKLLRIGRTIADLAQSRQILAEHCAEALRYRFADLF